MPGLDKTGPLGQGSKTGRKMRECKTENETPTDELLFGRGRGRGFGKGISRWLRLENEENFYGKGRRLFMRRKGNR